LASVQPLSFLLFLLLDFFMKTEIGFNLSSSRHRKRQAATMTLQALLPFYPLLSTLLC